MVPAGSSVVVRLLNHRYFGAHVATSEMTGSQGYPEMLDAAIRIEGIVITNLLPWIYFTETTVR